MTDDDYDLVMPTEAKAGDWLVPLTTCKHPTYITPGKLYQIAEVDSDDDLLIYDDDADPYYIDRRGTAHDDGSGVSGQTWAHRKKRPRTVNLLEPKKRTIRI